MPQSIERILEDLTGSVARQYEAALTDLMVATVRGKRAAAADARLALAEVVTDTLGRAEILGAMATIQQVAQALGETPTPAVLRADRQYLLTFAEINPPILPRVTFEEALADLVERAPVTIRDAARRTARNIAQLYGQGPVLAFVKAAEESVTAKAQEVIANAMRTGQGELAAGGALQASIEEVRELTQDWTEGYARMAFRTNVNTASTQGRMRQAQDPDIKEVAPAFRYDAVGDGDTRPNHNAMDGVIMTVDNPKWQRFAPPNGYNCRCTLAMVSVPQLRRMGRLRPDGTVVESQIPRGAGPDPGFK